MLLELKNEMKIKEDSMKMQHDKIKLLEMKGNPNTVQNKKKHILDSFIEDEDTKKVPFSALNRFQD